MKTYCYAPHNLELRYLLDSCGFKLGSPLVQISDQQELAGLVDGALFVIDNHPVAVPSSIEQRAEINGMVYGLFSDQWKLDRVAKANRLMRAA